MSCASQRRTSTATDQSCLPARFRDQHWFYPFDLVDRAPCKLLSGCSAAHSTLLYRLCGGTVASRVCRCSISRVEAKRSDPFLHLPHAHLPCGCCCNLRLKRKERCKSAAASRRCFSLAIWTSCWRVTKPRGCDCGGAAGDGSSAA